MFRIIPHNCVVKENMNDLSPAELQSMRVAKRSRDSQRQKLVEDRARKILSENMNDASPEERRAAKAKWSDDDRRWKVEADFINQLSKANEETSETIKLKNHIEHLKDLIRQAPQEDKIKLREIMKSEQAKLKKLSGGKIDESAIDDEDVHLQSAHDALSSRITKCKREGKDCKALEARLSNIAALLKKV